MNWNWNRASKGKRIIMCCGIEFFVANYSRYDLFDMYLFWSTKRNQYQALNEKDDFLLENCK